MTNSVETLKNKNVVSGGQTLNTCMCLPLFLFRSSNSRNFGSDTHKVWLVKCGLSLFKKPFTRRLKLTQEEGHWKKRKIIQFKYWEPLSYPCIQRNLSLSSYIAGSVAYVFTPFIFSPKKVGVFLQSPETLENPGSIIENLKITENFECLLLSRHHIMVNSTLLQVPLANLDLGKEINALINMG